MDKKYFFLLLLLPLLHANEAQGALKKQTVEYKDGETFLEGYLVYDDSFTGKRPGIMIVHEWTGLGSYEKMRAQQLAKLGYIAFAADIYGKGIRPDTREKAAQEASVYRENRSLMRSRAQAGIDVLRNHPLVKEDQIAAIGYCFGGGVVLELARSGSDIKGVVSFHGDLNIPNPSDIKNIKASVLVLHGAKDPYVSQKELISFWNAMNSAAVNWQINIYSDAVHSFTNPNSGDDPSQGVAYNQLAAHKSWEAMKLFFNNIFH